MIKYIIIIIWLLLGLIGVMATWHTLHKSWYRIFRTRYWNAKYKSALIVLLIFSPILVCGGVLTILLPYLLWAEDFTFYFKIPKE